MSGGVRFEIAPGTLRALGNRDDSRAYYTLRGDLSQMGTMERALLDAGFPVVKNDVYPGFKRSQEDKYREALSYIFHRRISGWWSQRDALLQYNICTAEEFQAAF